MAHCSWFVCVWIGYVDMGDGMTNIKDIVYYLRNLAVELDCSPDEIVDNLVGMVIDEEEASEIKENLSV